MSTTDETPQTVKYSYVSGHFDTSQEESDNKVTYISKGNLLAWGGTAIVERLPSGEVIKTPIPNPVNKQQDEKHRQRMRIEAEIYSKIGQHPRILKLLDWDPHSCCLVFEYMQNGTLGEYLPLHAPDISLSCRVKWVRQAVEGVRVLHSAGVIHCDITPRNFLLDSDLNLKICDFSGGALFIPCSDTMAMPSTYPSARFRRPDYNWHIPPEFEDDVFILGSLMYFIITGEYPFPEVSSEEEVQRRYQRPEFPDTANIPCGDIIRKCWDGETRTAEEVYTGLEHGI